MVKFLTIMIIVLMFLGFSQVSDVTRDAVVAIVAHNKAGEDIHLDNIDYSKALALRPFETWGITSNSQWLADQTRIIVPFFFYEKVTPQAIYPVSVAFVPQEGYRSIHVLGFAFPDYQEAYMNERSLYRDDSDARQILSTLIHELIHVQGGSFYDGSSEQLESATTAATLEVLAAMCNYKYELACKAFWSDVESLARSSIRAELGTEKAWLYDLFSNLFLRNAVDERASRKSNRFWADKQDQLMDIVVKYGQDPWITHVIPGVKGHDLDTGHVIWDSRRFVGVVNGMPFDDTRDLLGWLTWILW